MYYGTPYYGGYSGYGYGCYGGYQTTCGNRGAGYALILVLFILLVIIGASRF